MAFHNTNWTAVNLTAGTYEMGDLGDGLSASTVHQIFCITGGTIQIFAKGGGNFTWTATAGQKVDVVVARCIVSSGSFVGFKAAYQPSYGQSLRGY